MGLKRRPTQHRVARLFGDAACHLRPPAPTGPRDSLAAALHERVRDGRLRLREVTTILRYCRRYDQGDASLAWFIGELRQASGGQVLVIPLVGPRVLAAFREAFGVRLP